MSDIHEDDDTDNSDIPAQCIASAHLSDDDEEVCGYCNGTGEEGTGDICPECDGKERY